VDDLSKNKSANKPYPFAKDGTREKKKPTVGVMGQRTGETVLGRKIKKEAGGKAAKRTIERRREPGSGRGNGHDGGSGQAPCNFKAVLGALCSGRKTNQSQRRRHRGSQRQLKKRRDGFRKMPQEPAREGLNK